MSKLYLLGCYRAKISKQYLMPYIIWGGLAAFISTILVFLFSKLFLKSFFEERPQVFKAVLVLVPFSFAMIVSQWMRIKDEVALKKAGITREQYQVLEQKFRSFLNNPNRNSLYEKIKATGSGELVFDGKEVLWAKAQDGVRNLPTLSLIRWGETASKIAAQLEEEKCGELYLRTISATDFLSGAAKLDSKEFGIAIDLMLEQAAATENPVTPSSLENTDKIWEIAAEKLGAEKTSRFRSNIEMAKTKTLSKSEACKIVRDLWGSKTQLQNPEIYHRLVFISLMN